MRCLITVHVLLLFTGFAPAVAQSLTCCPLLGADIAERYRVRAIDERRFTHDDLWDALLPFDGAGGVSIADVGRSLHDRAIRAVSFGTGPTSVLLWSQMHGDESTATMALADVIRFFAEGSDDPLRATIRDKLSVTMVPMLNPDGAERYQRYNAAGVDINRDARRLATPEARALKVLRDTLEPAFGFNLHDQGARTTAGEHGEQVAVALLAPAADSARSYGPVRGRARQLAALLAQGLEAELPGRTAKYEDAFNPRAFGDLIQQWGTSTVLIESGALPGNARPRTCSCAEGESCSRAARCSSSTSRSPMTTPWRTPGSRSATWVTSRISLPSTRSTPPARTSTSPHRRRSTQVTGGCSAGSG
jgi:hypothetical protein